MASPSSDSAEPELAWIDYRAGTSGVEPIVDIELIGPGGASLIEGALLDTGADVCAFPKQWMARLGIEEEACDAAPLETAGGECQQWTYPQQLELVVFGERIKVDAMFADTPVALLGREDVFARFRVTFDQRAQRFLMVPYAREG